MGGVWGGGGDLEGIHHFIKNSEFIIFEWINYN